MFETTGGIKCPITNIFYVVKTEIVEIDNSLRFSVGEDDIEIQTVESLNSYYEELFALTNETLEDAQIVVDTNLVDLFTLSNITIEVIAMSGSGISANHAFHFEFYAAQKDKLNTLPVAAGNIIDGVVNINLVEEPSDPFSFTFTFNDTDKHNMTIYADGNATFPVGIYETMEQNETQRNFTIEIDLSAFRDNYFGFYEFNLVIADEYGSNSYPWTLSLVDITPPFMYPETAPRFVMKPKTVEISFIYGQNI